MTKRSLNTFANHAPKKEWLICFFDQGSEFFENNSLGANQLVCFTRFLSDAGLIAKKKVTPFFNFIKRIGWENAEAWAYILVQLSYSNNQFRWYLHNLPVDSEIIDRARIERRLCDLGVSRMDACSIINAFGRIVNETPLGTRLHFGEVELKGKSIVAIRRKSSPEVSPIVILYSLYRYAEAEKVCQITLDSLMDFDKSRVGMSPVLLFGMTKDELANNIKSLVQNHNDYIYTTTAHNSDIIIRTDLHNADDVLGLR